MPVRLIIADEWRPSIVMERRLHDLEKEGLLRPLTSSTRPEWIALPEEHRDTSPPEGYVVSFIKFHCHELGFPPRRFMRALLHHYGVELQHFSPQCYLHHRGLCRGVCRILRGDATLGFVASPLLR